MARNSPPDAPAETPDETLDELNRRISDVGAAATTAEARGVAGAGDGLADVTTDDVTG